MTLLEADAYQGVPLQTSEQLACMHPRIVVNHGISDTLWSRIPCNSSMSSSKLFKAVHCLLSSLEC